MMKNQENGKNGGKYYTKSWEKIMNQKNGGKYYAKSGEIIMNQGKWWNILYKITEKMVKIHENM